MTNPMKSKGNRVEILKNATKVNPMKSKGNRVEILKKGTKANPDEGEFYLISTYTEKGDTKIVPREINVLYPVKLND